MDSRRYPLAALLELRERAERAKRGAALLADRERTRHIADEATADGVLARARQRLHDAVAARRGRLERGERAGWVAFDDDHLALRRRASRRAEAALRDTRTALERAEVAHDQARTALARARADHRVVDRNRERWVETRTRQRERAED